MGENGLEFIAVLERHEQIELHGLLALKLHRLSDGQDTPVLLRGLERPAQLEADAVREMMQNSGLFAYD